ncbi:MAG: hypothetical protein II692_04990 [Paludibacteraceae bacterium]|nr:hypothetical protein [Paludibacteraceae bacterium]
MVLTVVLFVFQRLISRLKLVTIWPRLRLTIVLPKPTSWSFHEARNSKSTHRWNRFEDVFQTQCSMMERYSAIHPAIG